MAKVRFQLNPNETAQENLWRAVRIATIVVCKRYNWYGLQGNSRSELREEMELAAYRDFISSKVMNHNYKRVSKDGRKLCFMDNVFSSVWGICGKIADQYIRKVLDVQAHTVNIDAPLNTDSGECVLGDTFTVTDKRYYKSDYEYKAVPMAEQTPRQRASSIRCEYEEHQLDCQDLGISCMPMDEWLDTTGYRSDEDAMWFLLYSKEERKEIRKQRKREERAAEAARRKAEREAMKAVKKETKLRKELEEERMNTPPEILEKYRNSALRVLPKGWKFVQVNGIICITRSDDE